MKLDKRYGAIGTLFAGLMLALTSTAEPWSAEQQAVIDALAEGPIGIEKDFDRWADGYADEWTYWRAGDPAIRARDEHMGLVRDYIADGNRPVGFELTPVDVLIRGDVAVVRLLAVETLSEADGGERVVRYASATVMTRQAGRWQNLATNITYLEAE